MFFKKQNGIQWLVVFLGNPGPEYAETRHNVGFMTADAIAKEKSISIQRLRFQALTGSCTMGEHTVLLMKPQTFMNLSGDAAAPAAAFYKIPPERILTVMDDVEIPFGSIRVRRKGSAGGHNGIKSLIARLGTQEFPRIKIGVGRPPHPDMDMIPWVMGKFRGQDAIDIQKTILRAAKAVETYICEGPDAAMSKFNGM